MVRVTIELISAKGADHNRTLGEAVAVPVILEDSSSCDSSGPGLSNDAPKS